ncbi:MAG: hypothetical protein BGN83_01735 [Rhizobium sp. 63-7]|nr:MAG: hypothetical protein BGN83_01735 [Rhizobium sp. 63-7]
MKDGCSAIVDYASPAAISLFSPAGRSAERMRGDEGVFAADSKQAAPLIRRYAPPSPQGEKGKPHYHEGER